MKLESKPRRMMMLSLAAEDTKLLRRGYNVSIFGLNGTHALLLSE
jgi:hypothetical protein